MKRLFTTSVGVRALARLSALLTLSLALPASAELIGVDHFDYADGAIAGKNGGTFWDYKNVSPTGHTNVKSNWDYIGFGGPADISGGKLVTNGHGWAKREYNGQNESDGAISETNVAKAVYARVTVTTGATLPSYFGIASYDLGAERFFLGKRTNGTFGHEIIGGASGNTGTAAPVNSTFTLVFRLDFAGDRIQLFLNPNLKLPITDPANVAAGTLVADAAYTATQPSTALRLASGDSGDPITWDNFVVATTWEDLTTVVTTLADEDDGPTSLSNLTDISLREAVKYSATGLITFAPGLSGETITITHADGDMEIPGALTIDASALPGGITVSGNNTSRHFYLDTGKSLTLRGLTLTGGNAAGLNSNFGGAIFSRGTLTLTQCNLSGNTASQSGGAITNSGGTLTLTQCTLFGNAASSSGGSGGAILNQLGTATATLTQCTLSGNSARFGGVISNVGTLTLTQCTLSGNSAITQGGAIDTNGTLTLTNSIVAGNSLTSAGSGADINNFSTVTRTGANLVQSLVNGGSGTVNGSGTTISADPKLSPLGYFGGPVQTMHPLIGSPAIDAAGTANPGGTDARGFLRFVDGDQSFSSQLDIGAVEAGQLLTVTTAVDENNGPTSGAGVSLREAVGIAGGQSYRIRFLTTAFPAPITLSLGQLDIPATPGLFLDASNLTAPVTISGNNQSRIFNIPATATVAMHSLRIVDGKAADGSSGGNGSDGGGIRSLGALSLFSCAVAHNRSGRGSDEADFRGGDGGCGGGIFSEGPLTLTACTLSDNLAGNGGNSISINGDGGRGGFGGGICSRGPLILTTCTLSGNMTGLGGNGSGIRNGEPVVGAGGGDGAAINKRDTTPYRLIACTLTGNHTGIGGTGPAGNGIRGLGGGLSGGTVTLQNCLIAQNTGFGTAQDVRVAGLTTIGANLLGTAASFFGSNPDPAPTINVEPLLAPLGDYGGPTQTMALRTGSPARNAAIGSTRTTDQRGFPMVGVPDIGAYEAGTLSGVNLATTLAETLPGTGPASSVTPAADFDGDGQSNAAEITAGTLPADATSLLRITALSPSGGNQLLFFTSVAGKTYTLWRNDTLTDTWLNTGLSSSEVTPGLRFFTVPAPVIGVPKRFYRVQVGP